jgi:hypothetical protein
MQASVLPPINAHSPLEGLNSQRSLGLLVPPTPKTLPLKSQKLPLLSFQLTELYRPPGTLLVDGVPCVP